MTDTTQPASGVSEEMRTALRTALDHIEHMAKWIGQHQHGYSFESLGEDMPGMRAALSAKPAHGGDFVLVPKVLTPEMKLQGLRAMVEHIERCVGPGKAVKEGQTLSDEEAAQRYMRLGSLMRNSLEIEAAWEAMLAAAPPQPIPTPDEVLVPASLLSHMMPNPTKHAEKLYSRDQMLNYGERIRNATLAAMSRVSALSRARPEEAIREAALEIEQPTKRGWYYNLAPG